jgi:hypothetical protein
MDVSMVAGIVPPGEYVVHVTLFEPSVVERSLHIGSGTPFWSTKPYRVATLLESVVDVKTPPWQFHVSAVVKPPAAIEVGSKLLHPPVPP